VQTGFAGNSGPTRRVPYKTILTTGWLLLLALVVLVNNSLAAGQDAEPAPIKEALKYEGQRIARVEFEPAEQPLTGSELRDKLPFKPGSVFHETELRTAIQNLFRTGHFSDLAVDAEKTKDGVALKFITRPAYFVGRVTVLGVKAPPNSGQLSSAMKLRLGTLYLDSEKTQATDSLKSLLRQNGFYHASVGSEVQHNPATEQANISFYIGTGRRAHFESPSITGTPQRSEQSLIRATHWKRLYGLLGWQELTEARLRQGLDNIRHYYEKRELLNSEVTLTRIEYHDDTNSVEPWLDIHAGTRTIVRVNGARIGLGKLKQLVPIFQEHSIDSGLLLEGQHNIEQYLQSEGYFGSQVTYETTTAEDGQIITYNVHRGARHKFVYLGIRGAHYFPLQTIRERLYLQPAEFPRFPYGRFSNEYLKQDIQSIINLYVSNGFRDIKVTSSTQDGYKGRRDRLAVFITIHEGRQWLVSRLSVEGVSEEDLAVLQPRLASLEGQPFSEANVANDRERFLNHYYNRGYVNASFEYYVTAAEQPNRVEISYVVHPGLQEYVRGVIVGGLETTRQHLVYDRIELKKGEPLSLPEQTDSQRRLYELGIFARVNTAIQNPDGDEDRKYVLYDIDEARHYAMNIGVGAQIARIGGGATSLDNPAGSTGFAPRFAFGISRINFLGLGQTVGLQTALSTIEQRAAVTYFIPQVASHENLNLTTTTLLENSNDIRTFTAQRREGSIQLGQRLSRAYTVQYRLVFRRVNLSHLKINQLLVPLLSQPETVGLGEFSIIEDKRDDPTDAHHGIYTTFDLSYAPGFLGSQTHFGRGLFRNSTYHPVGRDFVFARSTQFGLIERTGGRPGIPLAERLYSGGSTSIRAFPDFQAGPRDLTTGFPLGGDVLFTNNLELRFPLYGDNVAGVLFHDAGNVYSSLGQFSLRFRQRNLQDFSYLVQSAGFGIRYRTPIGPIRLDLSFSPDAPRFFGLKGTLQDLINGTAPSTVQKINAFQFHFSLGQAF
jgi:outer membrane protein insertion porin family